MSSNTLGDFRARDRDCNPRRMQCNSLLMTSPRKEEEEEAKNTLEIPPFLMGKRERGGFILLLPLGGPAHLLAPNPKLAPRPTTDCKRPELHFETAAAYRFPSPLAPKPPPKRIAFHFLESKMRLDGEKYWRGGINHPAFSPVSPPRSFFRWSTHSLSSPHGAAAE